MFNSTYTLSLGFFSAVCPQQHYTVVCPDGHPGIHGCHVRLPAHRRRRQSGKDRVQEVINEPCCRVPAFSGESQEVPASRMLISPFLSTCSSNTSQHSVLYYKYAAFGQEKKCNILFIYLKVNSTQLAFHLAN